MGTVLDAVAELVCRRFTRHYRDDGRGRPAYEPSMAVALPRPKTPPAAAAADVPDSLA
jgi:hypothetical protein